MLEFRLEPALRLLTVTQTGGCAPDTTCAYEEAFRLELATLRLFGGPTACIIDNRLDAAQGHDRDALQLMIGRLGTLAADRTATVISPTSTSAAATLGEGASATVFTSMVRARDWAAGEPDTHLSHHPVEDEPCQVTASDLRVKIKSPCDGDLSLSPAAAIETARRMSDAAIDVLLKLAKPPGQS